MAKNVKPKPTEPKPEAGPQAPPEPSLSEYDKRPENERERRGE